MQTEELSMAQHVRNQLGQTLVEVLIALGSAVTIIVAIAGVTVVALNNAQFSRNQALSTQHTQEGIEFMRKIRDANLTSFSAYNEGTYCFDSNATTLRVKGAGCGVNVNNLFIREIEIDKLSPYCQPANPPDPTPTVVPTNATRITTTVYWTDGKCTGQGELYCHKAQQTVCLSDFTIKPTP